LESSWLVGKSSILRLGVERRRRLCAEDVETPFLKLLNEDGIEVTRDLTRALVAKLGGESRTVLEETR
jgi:hypothetical protein